MREFLKRKEIVIYWLVMLICAVLVAGHALAQVPGTQRVSAAEQPPQYEVTVNIALGKSASITAPSNRVTTHPGILPGTTTIEIDTKAPGTR